MIALFQLDIINSINGLLKTKINDPRLKFDPILEQILKLDKLDKNKFKEIIEKIA